MNSKKQLKVLVALATLMSTTAISSAAYAGDSRIHPGTKCQAYLGSEQKFLGSLNSISPFNNPTTGVHIVCPLIVRDNFLSNGTTKTGTTRAVVNVERFSSGSSNSEIRCELYAMKNGTFMSSKAQTAPAGFGKFALDISTTHHPGAAYNLFCFISNNTSIHQYTSVEP
jgi:hypothetical protein